MSRHLRALLLVGALAIGACDSGPEGPGTLSVRAEGTDLGAVVLEVEGSGVRGFAGLGSTRLYAGTVPGREGVHRVVLVDEAGGSLRFEMQVDDVGMDGPFVRVVTAATTANTLVLVPRVDVLVER
jgi:hypothetical protein